MENQILFLDSIKIRLKKKNKKHGIPNFQVLGPSQSHAVLHPSDVDRAHLPTQTIRLLPPTRRGRSRSGRGAKKSAK